jgi:hypothetical protein
MAKSSTPTFVLELPLVVTKGDERIILSRLEAGRRLYNAVLHEGLKRLSAMRSSDAWQSARKLPKGKERSDVFKAINTEFGFSEYALHDFVKPVRINAGWKDRLSAQEAQKIATRVFKTLSDYAFVAGKGKPRFKGINRPLHSLEGKQNTTGIRFRKELGVVEWSGLILPVLAKDTDYVHQALQSKTKYCRILWKTINGKKRFYVQLMQEGKAPNRELFVADGVEVGLDIGPSSIAVVSEQAVALETFAPSVEQPWAEIKRLQRALDRSRRACNPDNYHPDGRVKKGKLTWVKSTRYISILNELREVERKLAAARKRDHGELVNKILAQGNVIKTESISHKGFQKNFGRSAKVKASGMFFSHLTRKAESAGGKVIELNTRKLAMSQYDHVSDSRTKKPLSQRHHNLGDGISCVQRDIYSAFLALNASGETHNPHQLAQSWSAVEPLLRRTGLCVNQSAKGKALRFPTVLLPSERIVRHSILGTGQDVRFSRN